MPTVGRRQFETPQSRCSFGIARGDITPPAGIYHRMWGAATHERATGVHRPLTATAVVFRPAGDSATNEVAEQIIVALDHCLFFAREMAEMLDAVAEQTGAARESLLFAFSHTHAAGLMDPQRSNLPGGELIEPYLASLAKTVAQLVRQARDSVQPAAVVYGTGRCDLAGQRDFRDEATDQWVCGFNPGAPADDTVLVACVTDTTGKTLATFVNYACHPTTLAFENTLISPDFPGAMREVVEQQTGAPCVFLQGASGDLGPREGFVGDTAAADRNGRQLGFAALAALEALPSAGTRFEYAGPVVSGATLGIWKHVPVDASQQEKHSLWQLRRWTVPLPYRPELPTLDELEAARPRYVAAKSAAEHEGNAAAARDLHALIERIDRQLKRLESLPPGDQFPFPITIWRIGDAVWVGVEAEPYQHLQIALRQRFPATPILVITLANGSRPSYLPTAELYDTGLYQESIALLAPESLERLVDEIGAAIEGWRQD